MQAGFDVVDPTLRQALLAHLVQRMEANPEFLDELLVNGVSAEMLDHLRSRATLSDLSRVASANRACFRVSFDDRQLMATFEQTGRQVRDEQLKEYLARHGASVEMLSTWFCLSRAEVDALRTLLGHGRVVGRPRLPELKVRDAIHASWATVSNGRPEREAYFELHQLFKDLSVSALYQVVHEHDPSPNTVRRVADLDGTPARSGTEGRGPGLGHTTRT
jgi:Protein of unknown function (DUF2857)